ncbi:heterokaryon incompatibility protein-domain-containing protein [Cercophora newfieldiana]|uniref:Heterokaryon incompatibility protein-domain-containing protein n=1 Tax=Cercophora newfieldiana TaxID=92897 RepID=A0AA40CMN8_9PEZI|nr:heterokaryon incompatibility protein-domain-containing protein [Cercophora newfieldiana]
MSNAVAEQRSQAYAYASLTSQSSIRVLQVHGSDDPSAEISCTLKDEDLGCSTTPYEAISYAWEGQTPSHRISCDGLDMLVTENCAAILRHFRPKSSDQSRRLWIDAICIDQRSVLEKNHQLKLMSDVYRSATRVLVWLAPANPDDAWCHVAFDMFRRLRRLAALAARESAGIGLSSGPPQIIGDPGPTPDMEDYALVRECREILEASENYGFLLFKLLPWFTRLWTVQEVIVAREALFVLGEDALSFGAVVRLDEELQRLRAYHFAASEVYQGFVNLLAPHVEMFHLLWRSEQSRDTSLFSFGYFWRLNVSDPKDRVFAVQGLASALGITLPDPDYSKPLSTIYMDACRALIMHQGRAGVFHELNLCWLSPTTPGLPSWVPAVLSERKPCQLPPAIKSHRSPRLLFSKDGLRLHIDGLQTDTVSVVSESVIWRFDADNASRLAQDVRSRILSGSWWHRNLATELYRIRTLRTWIKFATCRDPVAVAAAMEALHSCLLLGPISGLYYQNQSYGIFERWMEVLTRHDPREFQDRQPTQDSTSKGSAYASLIKRCQSDQEVEYLTATREFEILQRISQDSALSGWQRDTERLGFMTLFKTASGKLGIGVFPIQEGDLIVHLAGNDILHCLRPNPDNEGCKIVATVYVHGLAEGDAENEEGEGYREFVIV